MAEITLIAERREERGSSGARRLRTAGLVPGIVYGHSVDPIPVSVPARELRVALSSEAGANALFDLVIAGDHQLAIARELQRHPVRQTISHVDFQVVRRDEIVPADVPVVLIGEATAVHRGDGSVEHLVQTIHVRAKPSDIPVSFEIDISGLEIGNAIRVGDLAVGAEVSIEADPDTLIVIAHAPRTAVEGTEETAAEGEGAGTSEAPVAATGEASASS